MAEFFSFLKVFTACGTVFFVTITILLALPQSKLRSVGLEMSKWALVCGLVILCISPIDIIPDTIPLVGWLDDVGYIISAIAAAKSALGERNRRRALEEAEFDDLLAAKRGRSDAAEDGDGEHDDEKKEAA